MSVLSIENTITRTCDDHYDHGDHNAHHDHRDLRDHLDNHYHRVRHHDHNHSVNH